MAIFKRVQGKFKIKSTQVFNSEIKRKLPIRLAVQIEKHFREGFEKGGGQTDDSRGGWKTRDEDTEKKELSKFGGKSRGILVKSGKLRRDVKQREAHFNAIRIATSNTTIDYAEVHNRGLKSGRGSGFTMPKREFIGASIVLEGRNNRMISGELKRMLI
jgi:phage gpG-like protein